MRGDGWSVTPSESTKQACPWRGSPNWGRWQGQLWHHMSHVRREGCRYLLTGGRICSTLAREMRRGCSAKMHIGRVGVCRLAGLFWVWGSRWSCLSSALPEDSQPSGTSGCWASTDMAEGWEGQGSAWARAMGKAAAGFPPPQDYRGLRAVPQGHLKEENIVL